MSTISLSGNTLNCVLGKGSFTNLGHSFSNVKKSSGSLSKALGSLKDKIDVAKESVKVNTSQESIKNSDNCEKNKKSALTVAYDKLDAFVSDVGTIDSKVSDKINDRKDSFYDKYTYLKPQCEKSGKEKWNEFWKGVQETYNGVVEAVKEIGVGIVDWVKENWIAIVTAIGVVVVAVLLVIFTPLSVAFVVCVAGIASLAMLVTDIIVACCNDGKGVSELLKENGHPVLAQIFSGAQWGCDIVQIVLPLGAAVKVISKVGIKTFFKTSFVAMKQALKETFEAVFKSGFKGGVKNALKLTAKSLLFDWDDLRLYDKNMLDLATNPLRNMKKHFTIDGDELIPISEEAIKVLKNYGQDSLKLIDGDVDWKSIAVKVADIDMAKINLPLDNIDNYLFGNLSEDKMARFLRRNTYEQGLKFFDKELNISTQKALDDILSEMCKNQFGLNFTPKVTPHDFISTKEMIYVPFDIHSLVNHNGAIAVYKNSLKTIAQSIESAMKNIPFNRMIINWVIN